MFAVAWLLCSGLASAAPCTLGVTVQPDSPVAGHPVAISYSAPYLGFIQAPSFSIDGNQITVDQPTVHADPASLGDIRCGQRTVQVGTLPPGYYSVTVRLSTSSPMSGSFIVTSPEAATCSEVGAFATEPTTPVTGRPVVLSFKRLTAISFLAPSVSVIGNQITVYDHVNPQQPPAPYPQQLCLTTSAAIASLPAGDYVVHWIVVDFNRMTDAGTYTFSVVPPPARRRAAR
ncbi:MAG TPA: hypothetical protein VN380_15580 [Thermoanaerobaculia bacterium]|nr:hypothetical protein [Thermoanaerobaculia bacterium]